MPPIKRICRGGISLAVAALFAVPMLAIVDAAPAAAACSPTHYYYVPSEAAAVSLSWNPECGDGAAEISNGTVYDTLCDSRAAAAKFEVADRTPSGSYSTLAISSWYNSKTGCNNSSTFSPWRTYSPGSAGWRLRIHLRACSSSSGCSLDRTYDYFG